MKTFSSLVILLLVLSSLPTLAQTKKYYNKNPFDRTFTKVSKAPSFGRDSLALTNYLGEQLRGYIPITEGSIRIMVLVDTTGKPLCEWIENNSNLEPDKFSLDQVIDEMPNWNAGELPSAKVNCAIMVTLVFNKQKLVAFAEQKRK